MKKMRGIVDPISLTFLLVAGIAAAGTVAGNKAQDEQQNAQNQETQAEVLQIVEKN